MTDDQAYQPTETEGLSELQEFVLVMAAPDSPVWKAPRIGRPRWSATGEPLPPTEPDAGGPDQPPATT